MSLMLRAHLALLTKLGAAALTYGFMLLIARLLAPEQFGQVAFFLNAAFLVAVLGAGGQQIALLRFLPALRQTGETDVMGATLRAAARRAGILTCGVAALTFAGALALQGAGGLQGFSTTTIALGCGLILAIGAIDFLAHLARGLDRTQLSLIPKEILWRACAAAIIGSAAFFGLPVANAQMVLAVLVGVLALLGFATYARLRAAIPRARATATPPKSWATSRNPFWLTSVSNVFLANADVVAVGILFGALETGGYFLANRLAVLLAFFAVSHNVVIGPAIARHWAAGSPQFVAHICTRAAWQMTLPTLCAGVVLAAMGGPILALFDPSYANAAPILIALVLAAIVNAASGPSDIALNLCGQERIAMRIAFVHLCVASVLIAAMGIGYGTIGVAWAVAIATIARKAMFGIALFHVLGLRTDVAAHFTHNADVSAARA